MLYTESRAIFFFNTTDIPQVKGAVSDMIWFINFHQTMAASEITFFPTSQKTVCDKRSRFEFTVLIKE